MNLFEHVGLPLVKDREPIGNALIPQTSIKRLAKTISSEIESSILISSPLIHRIVLSNLQDYFDSTNAPDLKQDSFREAIIVRICDYLIRQDILECRSMKEIHALVSGLYDSVLVPLAELLITKHSQTK